MQNKLDYVKDIFNYLLHFRSLERVGDFWEGERQQSLESAW